MDKQLLSILRKKQQLLRNNPDSIFQQYDTYLESNGFYRSLNRNTFEKQIKGHTELCNDILVLYNEAKLENERLVLLEDLAAIGYDKNKLVQLILQVFHREPRPSNLWEYADLLYSLKNYRYLGEYLTIIKDESYKEDRQMLILLVGKSKKVDVVPVLTALLEDSLVYGHALDALSNFSGEHIEHIMLKYADCETLWIRKIAQRYLRKRR